jgi:hypothetical protein
VILDGEFEAAGLRLGLQDNLFAGQRWRSRVYIKRHWVSGELLQFGQYQCYDKLNDHLMEIPTLNRFSSWIPLFLFPVMSFRGIKCLGTGLKLLLLL